MRPSRNTLPVNLIIDGRAVVVVGYGKVGRRKAKFLRECGARITVVSPEPADGEDGEGIAEFRRRKFEPGDCKGALAVFACTGDKRVNRAVLEDARRHGVPCCCSDMNWADGDFTTPATLRAAGATVAVSTNGASCATAKELRMAIAGFLSSRSSGKIAVVGIDDRTVSSGKGRGFRLPPEVRRKMAGFLFGIKGVEGLVTLDTCSRIENVMHGTVDMEFVKRLMRLHGFSEGEYFVYEDEAAFRHLVKVAAGLESAWAGEFHVVSQIKSAIAEAESAGTLDGRLKGFFDSVLGASKEVRHAVEGLLEVKEIEETVAGYLASRLDLSSAKIAILGSGAVGSAVASILEGKNVTVLHRNDPIPQCDALVCALACEEPVVHEAPPGCVVVDAGMPPNCSPGVADANLDDLKNIRRSETGAMDAAVKAADEVVSRAIAAGRMFDRQEEGSVQ